MLCAQPGKVVLVWLSWFGLGFAAEKAAAGAIFCRLLEEGEGRRGVLCYTTGVYFADEKEITKRGGGGRWRYRVCVCADSGYTAIASLCRA